MVAFCLEHADDDASLPTLAKHAADALSKEPVLAGAVLLFALRDDAAWAARRLWSAAPFRERHALARLGAIASELGLALADEELEMRYESAW